MTPPRNPIQRSRFDAALFDMDGVLTDTAGIHAQAWKQMFDEYLRKRATQSGRPFLGFDIVRDYKLHVDGKPRYDGVRSLLESRNIRIPDGLTL